MLRSLDSLGVCGLFVHFRSFFIQLTADEVRCEAFDRCDAWNVSGVVPICRQGERMTHRRVLRERKRARTSERERDKCDEANENQRKEQGNEDENEAKREKRRKGGEGAR